MKTIPVSLILTASLGVVAGTSWVGAQELEAGWPDRGRPFVHLWQQTDRDGDGAISRDEFALMPRVRQLPGDKRALLFERLDKDGDGELAREEIHGLVRQPHPGVLPPIWELDTDADGGVSFTEFQQGPVFQKLDPERQRKVFARLDSNGDGRITREDKPPRPPGSAGHGHRHGQTVGGGPGPLSWEMFKRLDTNDDGSVSREEFMVAGPQGDSRRAEFRAKRFAAMDGDGDGKVTAKEFAAVVSHEGDGPRRMPPVGPLPAREASGTE